ncbi:MAG: hypothetical protein WBA77_00410 [Microcoleaceae cyanobacterium]
MQLFATKIDDIHAQIKALQVEAAKLQDLENATASSLANLKAVIANVEGDVEAIATLKSAIDALFGCNEQLSDIKEDVTPSLPESLPESDFVYQFDSKEQLKIFLEKLEVDNVEYERSEVIGLTAKLINYKEDKNLLLGLISDIENHAYSMEKVDRIENCSSDESDSQIIHERELRLPVMAVKVAQLVKEHYHQVEVKDSKFIGTNPHHFSETQLDEIISEFNSREPIQLSEQAQWDSQTDVLYIWFKLKKTLKIWAEHYNVAHEDAIIRDQSDSSKEGYKYLLTVLRSANVDHTEWMTQQGKFDFSKTPQENRQQLIEDSKQQLDTEKYHILIQKNQESETVEIESSDEAYARKNYSSLVESIPDSYVYLMSNKRGCLETHKPPALSFMAAGMGWLNVIHNGEVLGMIYSDKTGWELETGEKFETREEAALAMLNSSSVAA